MNINAEHIEFIPIEKKYDAVIARIARANLKAHGLDIPRTVYFDEALDHLSDFYAPFNRTYYVLLSEGTVAGGIGLAEFSGFPGCCELQKLYLDDPFKGHGLGYEMIAFIERKAIELGYKQIYLETHTNLQAAIHIYEKSGYAQIEKPECVVHGAMNRFYIKRLGIIR